MGKRKTKARKMARALSAGMPLLHCPSCERIFVTEVSLISHKRDAHGPNATGKKGRKMRRHNWFDGNGNGRRHEQSGPTTILSATPSPRGASNYNAGPPPIMEVDFVTPSSTLTCTTCQGPGAMPLTGFCLSCDPLTKPQGQEAHRASSPEADAYYEGDDERIVPPLPGTRILIANEGERTPIGPEAARFAALRVGSHSNVLLLPRPSGASASPPVDITIPDCLLRTAGVITPDMHDRLLK